MSQCVSSVDMVKGGRCTKCNAWVENKKPYVCNCKTERRCKECHVIKDLKCFYVDKCANHFKKGMFYPCKRKYCCKECSRKKKKSCNVMKSKNMVRPPLGTPCDFCNEWRKPLVFEHCHKTNRFRGWLCNRCNTGLGLLGDGPGMIPKLQKYFGRTEQEAIDLERPVMKETSDGISIKYTKVNKITNFF